MELTKEQQFEGFKQIDYTILDDNTLKRLHSVLCDKFLYYDSDSNSYYFYTGLEEFDILLEEFDNFVYEKLGDYEK